MLPALQLYLSVVLCAATFLLTHRSYDHLLSTGVPDLSAQRRGLLSRRWFFENLATLLLALLHLASCCVHLARGGALVQSLVELISSAFFVRGPQRAAPRARARPSRLTPSPTPSPHTHTPPSPLRSSTAPRWPA